MSFYVIKSGFLATIQDYGRFHHSKFAMSQCGAADEHAYCWANQLLDNDFNAAALEIALGGVQLCAQADTLIAATGAQVDFTINDKPAPIWHSIAISKGDMLNFGKIKSGMRNYLAVKNGFDSELLFGSRSVNLRENIGKKLTTGAVLPYAEFTPDTKNARCIQAKYHPNYAQDIILRLLPSYQFNDFKKSQRHLFFNQDYQITNNSDRTGARLIGTPIKMDKNCLISEGISYGSVEISTDGLPIILLKDAPTIGGYPKIGTVFSLDLPKLAQAQPNTKVRFKPIDINQAQQQRIEFNRFFKIKFTHLKHRI